MKIISDNDPLFELISNQKIEWKKIRLGSGSFMAPSFTHKHLSNIASITRKTHGGAAELVVVLAAPIIDDTLQQTVRTVSDVLRREELFHFWLQETLRQREAERAEKVKAS